jgi:eukaryotic-like serine/threonine-protein kinase
VTAIPPPDRWRRIRPILEEALELPPDRRAAFLDQACGGDADLRSEIEGVLRADSDAGAFLSAPFALAALDQGGEEGEARGAAATIGSYRIVREIGRGGMGVVYEAEQRQPRRAVALKVILGGRHLDPTSVRMFQRETESLARLEHPGIAAIHESGVTGEGEHFLAMELVRGPSLSAYLEETGVPRTRPDIRRRLALFRKIAGAVAYAHQRGVLHLDLKPSNILVVRRAETASGSPPTGATGAGDVPDIKVLDFGLARFTDAGSEAATAVTAVDQIRGTLPYMSPEQLRGRRDAVDVRSDVYALGVVLYRMLSGRLPYDLEGLAFPESARVICEAPPRPLGAGPRAPRGEMRIDRDLSLIVFKALEKDPARRYATVAAFDEEIARYLSGLPILARAPSATYQIRKLVSRHKAPFAAAGAVLVLIVGFAVAMAAEARRIAAERDRANREATTAIRVSSFLADLFKVSDPGEARGNAIRAREILDKGLERIGRDLADQPEVQARLMLTMGDVYSSLGLYKDAEPVLARSLATRKSLFGEKNLDTLASMEALALCYLRQSRAAEGEALYRKIVEARRRLQGEEHQDTLTSMSGLAWAYSAEGRYADEEPLRRLIFETRRRTLGPDDRTTLNNAWALALSLRMLGRPAEAEALLVPTLETQRRVLGSDHPETLVTMAGLATLYRAQRRYGDAERLLQEALAGDRRVLGDDHPNTLNAMNALAVLYGSEGRSADEVPLLNELIERERRVLGPDHSYTLTSMNNLASVYTDLHRYDEAKALFLDVLGRQRRALGENHPDTVLTLYNLGSLEAARGRRREALGWLQETVARGFSRIADMEGDSNLESLRGDPVLDELKGKVRERARQLTEAKAAPAKPVDAKPAVGKERAPAR